MLVVSLLDMPVLAADAPYAGQQMRTIKALSDDDIAALRKGEGMGMAKAAELNGYPGPVHVLALAGQLGLTEAQQTRRAGDFRSHERRRQATRYRANCKGTDTRPAFCQW